MKNQTTSSVLMGFVEITDATEKREHTVAIFLD